MGDREYNLILLILWAAIALVFLALLAACQPERPTLELRGGMICQPTEEQMNCAIWLKEKRGDE